MSFRDLEQQNAAIEAAAHEQAKRNTVAYVYQKYPTLIQCDSNKKMIIELVERWAGPDVHPSPALFDSMLDENGAEALSMLAQQPVERTREQIRQDILRLLAAHSRRDEFMLKSEEARMKSWSLDALRIRLSELKTKIRMNAEPVSVLKEAVAASRPVPGFPILPKSVWNGSTHIPVNAAFFKSLDGFEIRRYTRLYSVEQVNARIAQG